MDGRLQAGTAMAMAVVIRVVMIALPPCI